MDREDAAFVADVLARRIDGTREDLERLAASSFARLLAASAVIRSIAGDWPAAIAAADELAAIAKGGGRVCDQPLAEDIQPFVESMRKLAGETPSHNRADRRRELARLPRRERLVGGRKPLIIGRPTLAR